MANPIIAAPSSYPHTVDGYFTGWPSPIPPGYEWFDVIPHVGHRSFVYFDTTTPDVSGHFQFYLMNDWTSFTLHPDGSELQVFEITYGNNAWTLEISGFPPSPVIVTLNPNDGRWFAGAAGWGKSPNSLADHTMWEIGISLDNYDPSKLIWVRIWDPVVPGGKTQTDEWFRNGFNVWPRSEGGCYSVVVPAPSALLLVASGLAGVIGLRRKRLL